MKKDRIRKALDIGEAQFEALYRQMGLTHESFAMQTKPGKPWKSPREVFSEGFPSSLYAQTKSLRALQMLENSYRSPSVSVAELEALAAGNK